MKATLLGLCLLIGGLVMVMLVETPARRGPVAPPASQSAPGDCGCGP
jgi:hypothetical protein